MSGREREGSLCVSVSLDGSHIGSPPHSECGSLWMTKCGRCEAWVKTLKLSIGLELGIVVVVAERVGLGVLELSFFVFSWFDILAIKSWITGTR